MSKPLASLFLAQAALIATLAATIPLLPESVATHFDAAGQPDAWAPRTAYAVYLAAASLLVSGLCAGPLYLARKLPDSLINIPERDHWLAPERRGETHERLFELGLTIATATTVLFIAVHLLTVRANRAQPPTLSATEALTPIVPYLAILGWIVWSFGVRAWKIHDDPRPRA